MDPAEARRLVERMQVVFARAPWTNGRPKWSILEESLTADDPEALAYVAEHLDPKRVRAATAKERASRRREAEEEAYEKQGLELEDVAHLARHAIDRYAAGKRVWLYHGTSSRLLPKIRAEGLVVGPQKVDPRETPGVYLTARPGRGIDTGGTAEFYARRASGRFGGEPVVLRVLVPYDRLEWDTDDEDIPSGRYQWRTDHVRPDEIYEIGGRRQRARRGNPIGRRRVETELRRAMTELPDDVLGPEEISDLVNRAERALGVKAKPRIYGCGAMGCVLPTTKKDVVLKISSSAGEYQTIVAVSAADAYEGFAKLLAWPVEIAPGVGHGGPFFAYAREDVEPVRFRGWERLWENDFTAVNALLGDLATAATTSRSPAKYLTALAGLWDLSPALHPIVTTLRRVFLTTGRLLYDVHYGNMGRRPDGTLVLFDAETMVSR